MIKPTIEDFENWLEECPVPYTQTDNGLNTTESYDFNLLNVDWSSKLEDSDKRQLLATKVIKYAVNSVHYKKRASMLTYSL